MAVTNENVDGTDAIFHVICSICTDLPARDMDVSVRSAHTVITEVLKLCAGWVPKMLNDEHKMIRVQTSMALLVWYYDGGKSSWLGPLPWTKPGRISMSPQRKKKTFFRTAKHCFSSQEKVEVSTKRH